jgi:hypothetical protein
MLRSNLQPNDQLPFWEMGRIHDSTADVFRTLVFQVVPIQNSLLEIAERSLLNHFAGVESRRAHPDCADAFLPTLLGHLGCRFAASRAPDQRLCHGGS